MRREPQKKGSNFLNKEPRLVRKSCTKIPKAKKGSNFLNSVPIFENFNDKFKSLSCNTGFCKCVNLMHALSNHFQTSSCLLLNHRGPSSRDFKGHFGNSVSQKSCSRHMTGTLELLSHYVNKEGISMAFGGNKKGKIKGYGMIVKGEITANQVSYVDGLKHNLISVSQLFDNGMDVMFKIKYCIVYKADTLTEVMRANRRGDLYLLSFDTLDEKEEICLISYVKNEEAWLWHTRFCHLNFHTLDKLPLQVLQVDLCGPIAVQTLNGKKFILVLVDEFSRFTCVEFVRKKSHVPVLLINLLKRLQVFHGLQVKVVGNRRH
ncbi:hypothetical protein OSB04_024711 [Centaurea solstitialis]|uniref:Integrase catalytic domain-containing protein n=1 Tax=Centaurea solstitialis TaxID=347529 RepID=A0AA38SNA3_9ASTR|nr:hypothetical protein OSB04_024711 [Centaurea solstitialis]